MRRAMAVSLLLAGCATTGGGRDADADAEVEARPDAKALAIETRIVAREVRIVLSDRWRSEAVVTAIHLGHPEAGTVVAQGAATFKLRGLSVGASEVIRVVYLADHENLLVHAREVKRFEQVKGYGHRTEDADMVTMANDQVSIFQQ